MSAESEAIRPAVLSPDAWQPERFFVGGRKKVIIDTDPGIDDAMAIMLAFQSPELEVVGLTTTFGNVPTAMATRNALCLREVAGMAHVPVAQGERVALKGEEKQRIADFVHGSDGLGNINTSPPNGHAIDMGAAEFMVKMARENPGQITVIALGPLTNVAKAIEQDPEFVKNVAQIIVLGGAFFVNGNVNPAAEANVYGDPDAADAVFISGADIIVIGLNVTTQMLMTEEDLNHLRDDGGPVGEFLHKAAQFYLQYHRDYYDMNAIYVHDPTTILAAIDPSVFTLKTGAVRVITEGRFKGTTLMNALGTKRWNSVTEWCGKPPIKVAFGVDSQRGMQVIKDRLMKMWSGYNGVSNSEGITDNGN
ncbi:hypothetical protein CBR_g57837 [Chara braunii]|uniref:Inosine/uridine-preferring nucleoside hydrolase domain-containing protein n=1 Tax=Chara braunii TaxID=69332 RepID=A0A388K847_CHABU|nr:hypothetical protein CBR_g57837 [Chara braunii]|eukprot:GBG66234.1 hypothetical protein CBR_g57837 [Chara braunii]